MRSLAVCFLSLCTTIGTASGQPPALPSPPPPPAFMEMKAPPLACFDKAVFDEDGLEFFVCNGGWGLAGVRRKVDPSHSIYVRDSQLAMNLNMRVAELACQGRRFAVQSDRSGLISFVCQGEEVRMPGRFKVASKSDWRKYGQYLH